MTVRFIRCFLFLWLAATPFYNMAADNAAIDSLMKVLVKQKDDTDKVKTMNYLSIQLDEHVNFADAHKFADSALHLATRLAYNPGIAKAYNNIGVIYWDEYNFPQAVKYVLLAQPIYKQIKDSRSLASSYTLLGNIYINQGNYYNSRLCYDSAMQLHVMMGDKKHVAGDYLSVGNVYINQGNYPEALKNYLSGLKIKEELHDEKGMKNAYQNIAVVYLQTDNDSVAEVYLLKSLKLAEKLNDAFGMASASSALGSLQAQRGNYTKAVNWYNAAIEPFASIADKQDLAGVYGAIGELLLKNGKIDSALNYFVAELDTVESVGNKQMVAIACNSIGNALTLKGKYGEARNYLMRALTLAKEMGFKDGLLYSYKYLASLDSATGNFKAAFLNYRLFELYNDSIKNDQNSKHIAQMNAQYETEKKDNEIVLLNKDKQVQTAQIQRQKLLRNGLLGGLLMVVLFLGIVAWQKRNISKEKDRSEGLLLNILPAEVADELKEKGFAEATLFDEVTVLFTDFKDFTKHGERLSPKQLVRELDECFRGFDEIISKYQIEKIKTVGDAYIAVSGLPLENANHAEDMVRAALEMHAFISRRINNRKQGEDGLGHIRAGIHSGEVVAGIVGVKKFAYDIWGDTVNTAARMEQNGEAGRVNISQTTFEKVRNKFHCTYRGKVAAKNKGEIDMYFVEG